MPILYIILILALIGVALWVLNTQIPWIDPTIKRIINVVAIVLVIIWLCRLLGVFQLLTSVRI